MKFRLFIHSLPMLIFLLSISVLFSGCSSSLNSTSDKYWPTDGWRTSTPEEQGIDSKKLDDMVAEIKDRDMKIHSILIIRNGYLVSETYFSGFKPEITHDMQSVGRSFTSTLVGIAIDKGIISGFDQRVLEFFPDKSFANIDENKQTMTLEDVLTMRTGLDWQESRGDLSEMRNQPDWIKYLLDKPMAEAPGTRWNYCSGCSHIFSVIINNRSGMNTREFAEENLFKPLGIKDVKWMTDPDGVPFGAGGFPLTPRDMAKLGYLYLRDGQWDGKQIVSSDWVRRSTQTYATVDEHFGYGYHWFPMPLLKGYAALGSGGQIVLVIPESDLIIATTAHTEESIFELIEKYVLPAVKPQ